MSSHPQIFHSSHPEPSLPENVHSLPGLLQSQCAQHPHLPFLSIDHQDGTSQTLTYGETWARALALSTVIRSLAQRSIVGIWFDKSIELHLAIFASTIAGSSWLPFDPDVPVERAGLCLKDSQAGILLCDGSHLDRARAAAEAGGSRAVSFADLEALVTDSEATWTQPEPSDTAYMIYTSGSTGTPKGIEISHLSALTFALSERSILGTNEGDTVWQGFSPAFDMFIEEVWVSVAGAAHLWIGNKQQCQDVASLGGPNGVWATRGVTLVNAVPTLINIMTSLGDGGLPASVRLLNLGGEACPPALVKTLWSPQLTIVNTYGPTETTVTATYDILHPDAPITIGQPLPSYHAMLFNDDNVPVDLVEGAQGQLCIGGPCVGKGYVGRPDLTAAKFITHPILSDHRAYLTGDLVRYSQGKLFFLGRIDHQVKHRGFRIELGEIENVISAHPAVQTCAVICARAGQDNAKLEAYVVLRDGESEDLLRSIQASTKTLPSYMRPEGYVFLSHDKMPRLASGKINLNALHALSNEAAEKETEVVEEKVDDSALGVILSAMKQTFPQAASTGLITPTADFFCDLGGHSLVAALLVSRIRKSARGHLQNIGLADVYALRTAEAMASHYGESDTESVMSISKESVESLVHHDIPYTRYVLCAIAQIPPLLFLSFVSVVALLGPYIVFEAVYDHYGTGFATLAAYASFVLVPIFYFIIGLFGKWVALAKAKEGRYPLYGFYYYRWWLAGRFLHLIDQSMAAESPLYSTLLRLLGAKVGDYCHMGIMADGPALNLVSIGDDVVIGRDVVLAVSVVEKGELVLRRIEIGNEVHIGSHCVVEGGCKIEDGAKLGSLSMLPAGTTLPAGEHWAGSPARRIGFAPTPNGKTTRPSALATAAFGFGCAMLATFAVPILYLIPQLPGLVMFVVMYIPNRHLNRWDEMALISLPASLSYIICVFVELVICRHLILGKMKPGKHRLISGYMLRKWLIDRLMDMSLVVLHPVYATLYVVPYLRALGVKIGRGAEVSNIRGVGFELTEIGNESFLADNVLVGETVISGNEITFEKTILSDRAFAGNSALLPQGTNLPSNSLVGVLSIAPESLNEGQSCFGSPAIKMPPRPLASANIPDHLLWRPRKRQIALRLFIEGLRLWLPRFIVILGLALGLELFRKLYQSIGYLYAALTLPLFELCLFSLPAVLITVALKWALVGTYKPSEWPLWSHQVWLSEFVTSLAESLLAQLLLHRLVGTPYLNMILRMLGAHIGSRCTLLSHDMTEWDMVSMGDQSVMNLHAGPQTHLFEDRVMRVNRVDLGPKSVMKPYAICLPNSSLGEGSELASLSLVMRGESVPAYENWQGIPIRRA